MGDLIAFKKLLWSVIIHGVGGDFVMVRTPVQDFPNHIYVARTEVCCLLDRCRQKKEITPSHLTTYTLGICKDEKGSKKGKSKKCKK